MTEQNTWREREVERQKTRKMPVWSNEPFWRDHAERHADHFVHLSEQEPPLLAYTVDESKGVRDIQTRIKAGRYLAKYFAYILTAKQIGYFAAWQANGTKPRGEAGNAEVQFASTAEDIVDVYTRGPRSCMDGENFAKENSPVRVYAAGDLAIAYLESEPPPNRPAHNVIARCLVWPEKKIMGRVYPTPGAWQVDGYNDHDSHMAAHHALESKLKEQGFSSTYEGTASFSGARLLKKRRDGKYVMPYLDQDYLVDDDGGHFIMREEYEGAYTCQETSGCLGNEKEETYDYSCDRCEEGNNDGTSTVTVRHGNGYGRRTEEWCEHCVDCGTFTCEGYDRLYSDDMASVEVNGSAYSEAYVEENFYLSDYSNDWFDPGTDEQIKMNDGDTWAESEFDKYGFECVITGENYSRDDMHTEHENVWSECTDEEIAAHFAEQEKEAA